MQDKRLCRANYGEALRRVQGGGLREGDTRQQCGAWLRQAVAKG